MIIRLLIPFLILCISISCYHHTESNNQFELTDDTLVINCQKQKGDGLFMLGVMPLDFIDTTTEFDHPVKYPKQITEIKRNQLLTVSAEKSYYIDIIKGKFGDKEVFVIDENNNQDFRDDTIRIIKPVKWHKQSELIKCKYFMSIESKIITDSSWLRIGEFHNGLWYGKSEHLIAEFQIGNNKYKVGIIDPGTMHFTYKTFPQIAILKQNENEKDTLYEKDLIKLDEFLNFNGTYYRFKSINENGYYLTLIKEKNFQTKIGTQVGMIAPDFICKTISGDTIKSSNLHDKMLIIANSCGCGGDKVSTKAYFDIRNRYGKKIQILHLDSKFDKKSDGLQIDMNDEFNKDIYQKYRNMYCSRTCYLISKDNRIVDKFPVSDWMSYLPEYLENK